MMNVSKTILSSFTPKYCKITFFQNGNNNINAHSFQTPSNRTFCTQTTDIPPTPIVDQTNNNNNNNNSGRGELPPFCPDYGKKFKKTVIATPKHPSARIPKLFTPFTLREVELKNRIMVSPMCQYSAEDGYFNEWHLVHLGAFAKGGAGLVMYEATAVREEGRITPWCTGLWKEEHIAPLKRINDFMHRHDTKVGLQLAHAGRKASTYPPFRNFSSPRVAISDDEGGWKPIGPSGQPYSDEYRLPHQVTRHEIADIVRSFIDASERALAADFDVIEIHAAHGYLLSSFLSPLSNLRTDEYGGDFTGRTKIVVDLVTGVRRVWPSHKPLFVRLSCVEFQEKGWSLEESIQLAQRLKQLGVDLIDCSSSGISSKERVQPGPGYQIPYAEAIKAAADIPTAAVGLITKAAHAEEILINHRADLIAIGREFLREPYWPLKAAKELGLDVHWPAQLEWAV